MQSLKRSKLVVLSSAKLWTLHWILVSCPHWVTTLWTLTCHPATAPPLNPTSLAFQLIRTVTLTLDQLPPISLLFPGHKSCQGVRVPANTNCRHLRTCICV